MLGVHLQGKRGTTLNGLLTRGEVANCLVHLGYKGCIGHGAKMRSRSQADQAELVTLTRTRHWYSRKRSVSILPFVGVKYTLCLLSTCPVS